MLPYGFEFFFIFIEFFKRFELFQNFNYPNISFEHLEMRRNIVRIILYDIVKQELHGNRTLSILWYLEANAAVRHRHFNIMK